MKTSHRRARARGNKTQSAADALPTQPSGKTLIVCSPTLGSAGMPAAEFGPAAASDIRPNSAEVFHVMAQHAASRVGFRGVVISPCYCDPLDRQRAAVTAAHHFPLRSDAVRALDAVTWVPVPSTMRREELAQVLQEEAANLRYTAGEENWVLALWHPDAFGFETGAAKEFAATAVFGTALTL
jgi:hypothetical protein